MIYILILVGWTVCMIHVFWPNIALITNSEEWFHQIVLSTVPTCQGSPNKKATAGASQGTKAVVKSICRHTTSLSPFYLRTGLGGGATSNILELNTSENGEIYFVCTRLVFPTNSMQSLHDGDRWTWQDHLALQVHISYWRVFNSNHLHTSGWSWASPSQLCRRQGSMWSLWGTRALISRSGKEEGGAW